MFSVIMPAYNAESCVAAAISSVLRQHCGDFELIIVNDGSADHTQEVIDTFKDPRIRCLRQENAGVSAARNRGILAGSGEYVCFLDADDTWRENHLEELSALIREYPDCGMYITGYDIRLQGGAVLHRSEELLKNVPQRHFESRNGYDMLLQHGYFFNTNTLCCKREVFDRVGLFQEGVTHAEDDDMWFRIFAYYSIAVSKEVTTIYDRSNSTATATRVLFENVFRERVDALLASPLVPDDRKASLRIWCQRNTLSLSRRYLLAGNKPRAWTLLRTVDVGSVSKRKYLETILCMLIPTRLIVRHIDRRDRAYYR